MINFARVFVLFMLFSSLTSGVWATFILPRGDWKGFAALVTTILFIITFWLATFLIRRDWDK